MLTAYDTGPTELHINRSNKLQIQVKMIAAGFLIEFLTNIQLFWTFTEAKTNCATGFCQTYPFDIYRDPMQDREFINHVFHNSVTLNPVQCYMWCIHDCRCLSFNYKEKNDTKYCELNEGSIFINMSSLERSPGTRHYHLRREYHRQVNIYRAYLHGHAWIQILSSSVDNIPQE